MEYICAGTLISPSWVVLARHCFLENYKQLIKSNKLAIALGDNDLKNMMIQNISVAISLAEDIEESASVLDLMLIKLQHPVQMGVSVKPACLLNYDKLYRFRGKLISLGWGSTIQSIYSKVLNHWSSSPTPNQLKQVQMTDRYENLKCRGRLDLICVNGLVQDSGPCLGDSGGPLILQIERTLLFCFHSDQYVHLINVIYLLMTRF